MNVALAVIAKAPLAGRVKTRLCPPCTPEQAASLAEAALVDTLQAVLDTPATRRICVLDGEPGPWLPEGFEVIPQVGGGLDERLASAFETIDEPTFLVGMDTPQLTSDLLTEAVAALTAPGIDAALGMTEDGGYWGIGLHRGRRELLHGVPMSQDDTGAHQLTRLLQHGLVVETGLPVLADVDEIATGRRVAALAPDTNFAAELRRLALDEGPRDAGQTTTAATSTYTEVPA